MLAGNRYLKRLDLLTNIRDLLQNISFLLLYSLIEPSINVRLLIRILKPRANVLETPYNRESPLT
jgi:hypothetical protein